MVFTFLLSSESCSHTVGWIRAIEGCLWQCWVLGIILWEGESVGLEGAPGSGIPTTGPGGSNPGHGWITCWVTTVSRLCDRISCVWSWELSSPLWAQFWGSISERGDMTSSVPLSLPSRPHPLFHINSFWLREWQWFTTFSVLIKAHSKLG